jgi:hypothetical protein
MPFYFLAVRPWVNDIKRVACIELAGPKNGKGKLMDLSDVKSVNDLMTKKAIPIRNITFKHVKDVGEDDITGGTIAGKRRHYAGELRAEMRAAHKDETLGETLQRVKQMKKEAQAKKKAATQMIRRSSGVRGKPPYNPSMQHPAADHPVSGTIKPVNDHDKASMESVTLAQLALEQVRHSFPPTPGPVSRSEPHEEESERIGDDLDASNDSHSHVEVHHVMADTDAEDETETDIDELGTDFDEEDFSEFSAEEELELPSIMAEKFETSMSSDIDMSEQAQAHEANEKLRQAFSVNTTEDTTEESSVHCDNPIPKKTPSLKSCMKVKTLHESLRKTRPDRLRNSFDSPPSRPPRIPIQDSSRQRRSQSMYEAPPARLGPEPILDAMPALPRRRTSFTDDESCCSSYDDLLPSSLGQPLELQWGQVQVREYDICLGDNPACSEGAPISLDWHYQSLPQMWLETYELSKGRPRRVRRLRGEFRKQILVHYGYCEDQQKKAITKKQKDQKMRAKTVNRLKYMKFDQQVEKMFRVFPAVA